jgi:hypothetical protein
MVSQKIQGQAVTQQYLQGPKDAAVYGMMRIRKELRDLVVCEPIYRKNQCVPHNWSVCYRVAIEPQTRSIQFGTKGEPYDIEEAYFEHPFRDGVHMSGKQSRVLKELGRKDESDDGGEESDDGRNESESASPETDSGVPDVGRPSSANLRGHTTGKTLGSSKANPAQGKHGMLEEKFKTSEDYFFLMGKDPKARGKKSKVVQGDYQVPPYVSFNNVDEENAAWVCELMHSKGVAAGMDVYNPGTSRSCAGCRTSRRVYKKKVDGKNVDDLDEDGNKRVVKDHGKTMDFSMKANTCAF